MGAIGGIYTRTGEPLPPGLLASTSRSLTSRGGHERSWSSGPIGLLQRGPRPGPPSWPFPGKSGPAGASLVGVVDARLDNRDELVARLGVLGPVSDEEIVLLAYRAWADRAPERLLGDFAFAIWDPGRETLFCARDPFGVKPFYYHVTPERFAFASEVRGLLAGGVDRRLNEAKLADYWALLLEDEESTFFAEVRRLPPAHSLEVGRERFVLERYWALDPAAAAGLDDEEVGERFREHFTMAVRSRLDASEPVAAALSGGLDSSSIVTVARRELGDASGERLHTFSALFPDHSGADESEFIRAVTEGGGLVEHSFSADEISPLEALDAMLEREEEPFLTFNLHLHWKLYRLAREAGARSFLDGIDGDAVVSAGYERLQRLAYTGRWISLWRETRRLARRQGGRVADLLRRHASAGLRARCLPWLSPTGPLARSRIWESSVWNGILREEFIERTGLRERWQQALESWCAPTLSEREQHVKTLKRGLLTHGLEVADRAAATFGVEPRYPFLDRRLVEFCVSLAGRQKLREGWTRYPLRAGLGTLLPDRIRWRSDKGDLSRPFASALLAGSRSLLDEIFFEQAKSAEDMIAGDALRRLYSRFLALPTNIDAMTVWKSALLIRWLHRNRLAR